MRLLEEEWMQNTFSLNFHCLKCMSRLGGGSVKLKFDIGDYRI